MFNMNDIYVRLANGEKIDDIGNEIAAMMNEAVAKHQADQEAARAEELAKQALIEKEQAKHDLMEELVEIIQELAILEGMDPDDLQVTDEDVDQLVAAFTEMFAAMRDLKALFTAAPAVKKVAPKQASAKIVTDDQILADFIKMFN